MMNQFSAETLKPVKRGDVLLTSQPFVYLVSGSLKSLYCDFCMAKKSGKGLRRCSGCRLEHYCGRECQAAAWKIHRLECQRLKRVAPRVPPDTARLMAKIVSQIDIPHTYKNRNKGSCEKPSGLHMTIPV
ncbi:Histone-lysine N-methyltransferase SMYD3 [Portunus trituberculatus]|uniref:Histone-lysine N-methyltransferase SMYD3 n=1 Tax=Portunus trituberculatus TaxID=210409 RepID=A0A5B7H370_PORTR|nr:Histone-lysine N-methyltransferase SMYD3 [Portunus trituberculatus]